LTVDGIKIKLLVYIAIKTVLLDDSPNKIVEIVLVFYLAKFYLTMFFKRDNFVSYVSQSLVILSIFKKNFTRQMKIKYKQNRTILEKNNE
jgi:hypothetical protein